MQKKLRALIIIFVFMNFSLCAMEQREVFSIEKKNDGLYVGEIAGKFYVALERINEDNLNTWLKYSRNQHRYISKKIKKGEQLMYLPNANGAKSFKQVLECYKKNSIKHTNELWIAYASRKEVTGKAFLQVNSKKTDIEMYMTVITSPNAFITSHMGISRTWEMAEDLEKNPQKKHKYQSLYLHAFAARVMRQIDSKKIYMMTAPNELMYKILLKKLPLDSIFLENHDFSHFSVESNTFYLFTLSGEPLVVFNELTLTYQWLYTQPYKERNKCFPYVLIVLEDLARFGIE
jgi:hypothetical protein